RPRVMQVGAVSDAVSFGPAERLIPAMPNALPVVEKLTPTEAEALAEAVLLPLGTTSMPERSVVSPSLCSKPSLIGIEAPMSADLAPADTDKLSDTPPPLTSNGPIHPNSLSSHNCRAQLAPIDSFSCHATDGSI